MVQPTANTELTIAFIRIIESVMCFLCLLTHINSLNYEEPMPHIVLFCGTFGGFFILSLAKLVVPISGQLSPPGVDLVFSFLGFILFYIAAVAAMFYVQRDPHLVAINGQAAQVDEVTHPFFQQCVKHAILSISTGTLFLMHAVISADRLTSFLKGNEEDVEREIYEDDIDIYPDETISLHLFFLNWLIMLWNSICCRSIRKLFKKCQIWCIEYYRKKRPPSNIPSRRVFRRARILRENELTRLNGITVSSIAPQEFIRNPRRTLTNSNMLAFVENGSIVKRPRSVETEQELLSRLQDESQKKSKNVLWDIQENGSRDEFSPDIRQNQDPCSKTSRDDNNADFGPLDSEWEYHVSFTRNKEFGSDEDLPTIINKEPKAAAKPSNEDAIHASRQVSFIRNEAFDESDDAYDSNNLGELPSNITKKRNVSFIQNEAFGNDEEGSSSNTTQERQISFIRNKDFGSERQSRISRFFSWLPRKRESVVQNIDENTIRTMETFTTEAPSQPNSRANLEENAPFKFEEKSSFLQEKRRPKTEQEIPISENQETTQPIVFAASDNLKTSKSIIYDTPDSCPETKLINENERTSKTVKFENIDSYPYTAPDIDLIYIKKEPKTFLQNQYRINEDTSEKSQLRNEKGVALPIAESVSSVSYIIQIPQNNTRNKKSTIVTSENMATNAQPSNLPTPNLIPYILTSKINKITLNNEIANAGTERNPSSYMKKIGSLIPSNKVSEISTENQTTNAEYSLIPSRTNSANISEIIIEEFEYGSTSYMKEVTERIPTNRITESTSNNKTKEAEYQANLPALDSSSYMMEVANLIASNKMSNSISKKQTEETDYCSNFPVLSTSYLQTITGLIPSSRNTDKKEGKKKSKTILKKKNN